MFLSDTNLRSYVIGHRYRSFETRVFAAEESRSRASYRQSASVVCISHSPNTMRWWKSSFNSPWLRNISKSLIERQKRTKDARRRSEPMRGAEKEEDPRWSPTRDRGGPRNRLHDLPSNVLCVCQTCARRFCLFRGPTCVPGP